VSGRSRSCRASVAIRSSRVEIGTEPDVSSIFPSHGSVSRRALRSTGSLGSVPPRRRYYDALRLLAAHPTALRCLRLAVPPQFSSRRRRGLPSSSATLMRACPGSSTPAEPREQDLRDWPSLRIAPPVLPSGSTASSASTTWKFRGPIPQPTRSLSTLRGHGRPCTSLRPRKTRFRLAVLPWPDGLQPAGSRYQVSARVGLTWLPPGRG
jgi:hypothetical protein